MGNLIQEKFMFIPPPPPHLLPIVGGFIKSVATRIFTSFVSKKIEKKTQLPARLNEEERAYLQRKEIREQEMVSAQKARMLVDIEIEKGRAERENYALQLKEQELADRRQIEKAHAERENRLIALGEQKLVLNRQEIQLKKQELADRRELGALFVKVEQERTIAQVEMKKQEIQALHDQGK